MDLDLEFTSDQACTPSPSPPTKTATSQKNEHTHTHTRSGVEIKCLHQIHIKDHYSMCVTGATEMGGRLMEISAGQMILGTNTSEHPLRTKRCPRAFSVLAPLDFSAIPGNRWCSSHLKDEKTEAQKIGHWSETADPERAVPMTDLLLQLSPCQVPALSWIPCPRYLAFYRHSQEMGKQETGSGRTPLLVLPVPAVAAPTVALGSCC